MLQGAWYYDVRNNRFVTGLCTPGCIGPFETLMEAKEHAIQMQLQCIADCRLAIECILEGYERLKAKIETNRPA